MSKETTSALTLLADKGVSILDAARIICNILDARPQNSTLTPLQFCAKVVESGKHRIGLSEMPISRAFSLYLETKKQLRKDSFRDIRYLGTRLINSDPKLAERNFSELGADECEMWLSRTFTTASQFNKARVMLHGLFEFALKRQWCEKNVVKLVERKKVFEREIEPLKLFETNRIISAAKNFRERDCLAACALLIYAGIRPREVRRLKWRDIDLVECCISVRSQCSKTGGVRQVEICPALKKILDGLALGGDSPVCPPDWDRHWRKIRGDAGFGGHWVQDVLRHTYASYFAKRYRDLPRLQSNMGHRDLSLLRSRYVNMVGIKKSDAKAFFESLGRDITFKSLPLKR